MKVDADRSLRTHTRLLFRPDEVSKIDFFANYELCSQDAFPFYLESVSDDDYFKDELTPDVGHITSNDDNTYLRHLLNIGLKTEYNWPNVILGNVLGFQLLNDELKMDGDFTHLSLSTVQQMQRSRTLGEEIILKSRPGVWRHWEWITGAGFSCQWLSQQFSPELGTPRLSDTPTNSAALYHQSRFCDIFNAKGWDVTLGLRLEYEYARYSGESNDWWQLLPSFSMQYSFAKGNVYGTVSRGYRSGGYDCHVSDVPSLCLYKPEYAWNYELGTYLNPVKDKLSVEASVFLTNVSDLQLGQTGPFWLGEITRNAGRSRSFGGELSIRAQLTDRLRAHAGYSYTHASFTEYVLSSGISCEGNRVPFAPQHAVDLGANYTISLPKILDRQLLDRMVVSANWHGLGKIFWTEDNLVSEPFYSALDAKITFYRKHLEFGVWAANIYDSRSRTFYFQSMKRGYAQLNRPFQCGFEMKLDF